MRIAKEKHKIRSFNCPDVLWEQLEAEAKNRLWSVSQYIVQTLSKSVSQVNSPDIIPEKQEATSSTDIKVIRAISDKDQAELKAEREFIRNNQRSLNKPGSEDIRKFADIRVESLNQRLFNTKLTMFDYLRMVEEVEAEA